MATSSHDRPLSESVECVLNESENETGPFVTPQKHVADVTPNLCTPDTFKSPLDFSTVTVEQLGITPESFVKTSSGKSSSSLQKNRRRSTVGLRGSPETNCLIRFIAQQRNLKNAARSRSSLVCEPQFQGSPRLYRNAGVLRERMSAFRSAFHPIQETEKMASGPSASEADRESKIADLTNKEGLVEYQQSGFPVNSSSKRRRISSQDSPDDYLSGTKTFADGDRSGGTSTDLAEKSSGVSSAQPECTAAPLPELKEASQGLAATDHAEGTRSVDAVPPLSSDTATATRSPEAPVCGSSSPSTKTFVLRSVLKKPGKLFSENGKEYNLCDVGTHLIPCPSNCCKEERAGKENCKTPGCLNLRKRKRVTFGEDLSPEVFDESLPANTPLCKGGTPVRPRIIKATSPLQSPVHEQFLQPNFDDKEENLENIEPSQGSFAILSPSKSSLSETPPGTNTCSSLSKDEEIICSVGKRTRTSHRIKQMLSSAGKGICNSYTTQAEPSKEKMNGRKSQEKKHKNNALPKKKQVLKCYRKKKRKGKKGVEKCLYGQRDIASKKPLLSPIPELPEASEATPLADCTQRTCSDDFNRRGEPEEVNSFEIPRKRKRCLPQKEDLPELDPARDQSPVSDVCCNLLPLTAGSNACTRDTDSEGNTRAETKCQSAKEPETGTTTECSRVLCASVTQGHLVSGKPQPLGSPQNQGFLTAGQNLESPCEILMVSESVNIKCEKDSECPAPQGTLQGSPFSTDSEREPNCSEDVLTEKIKEATSSSENVERKCADNGGTASGKERKWRTHTVCCEGQSSYLEQNGKAESSYSGKNSVEITLENPQLVEELSNTIEQSFQRISSKTKVRRSTRLQGNLENTGLVWLSPSPSTSWKPKRRMTIGSLGSMGFESASSKEETVSSGQNPGPLPAISGSESQGARSSELPKKRRKSFCVSTLTDANSSTQPPHFKRNPSLEKEGSSQLP